MSGRGMRSPQPQQNRTGLRTRPLSTALNPERQRRPAPPCRLSSGAGSDLFDAG